MIVFLLVRQSMSVFKEFVTVFSGLAPKTLKMVINILLSALFGWYIWGKCLQSEGPFAYRVFYLFEFFEMCFSITGFLQIKKHLASGWIWSNWTSFIELLHAITQEFPHIALHFPINSNLIWLIYFFPLCFGWMISIKRVHTIDFKPIC